MNEVEESDYAICIHGYVRGIAWWRVQAVLGNGQTGEPCVGGGGSCGWSVWS